MYKNKLKEGDLDRFTPAQITEMQAACAHLRETYGTEILIVRNRQFDISATEIRNAVSAGRSLGGMVPPAVERYIREHGLYL
jgi:nicotinic acid mononucleotide adenylyltransferase